MSRWGTLDHLFRNHCGRKCSSRSTTFHTQVLKRPRTLSKKVSSGHRSAKISRFFVKAVSHVRELRCTDTTKPLGLLRNQGPQFESELFAEFNKLLGTRKIRTTAYHPQANGIVERWHRTLKNAIKCHANSRWMETLPTILLGLRSVMLENIKASPAELVYGTSLRLPFHFFEHSKLNIDSDRAPFVDRPKDSMNKLMPVPSSDHSNLTTDVYTSYF